MHHSIIKFSSVMSCGENEPVREFPKQKTKQIPSTTHQVTVFGTVLLAIATLVAGCSGDSGSGNGDDSPAPGAATFEISTGFTHSCTLTGTGTVWCWGDNSSGQIGNGGPNIQTATQVDGFGHHVTMVSAGAVHTCAITDLGKIMCMGNGSNGLLGSTNGIDDDQFGKNPTPIELHGFPGKSVAISAGSDFTCGLSDVGIVYCWGNNSWGQLGSVTQGVGSFNAVPTEVVGLGPVVSISAGGQHACALTESRHVKCWGLNWYGQLGDGTSGQLDDETSPHSSTPITVSGLGTDTEAISAGGGHTCALSSSGAVRCWGAVTAGSSMYGIPKVLLPSPTIMRGLESDVVAISAGIHKHACAVKGDGAVMCWGENSHGQVGNGASGFEEYAVDPEAVVGLESDAVGISAGGWHTCAKLANGKAVCWGYRPSVGCEVDDPDVKPNVGPVEVVGFPPSE